MRCEDFPCCGHYEESTGEIFCFEATEPREDRERRLAHEAVDREFDRKKRAAEERAVYAAAPDEHNDVVCEGTYDDEEWIIPPNPCKECLSEAHDQEQCYLAEMRYGC